MEEMLSLYDYLGRAAGSKLGKDVFVAAAAKKLLQSLNKYQILFTKGKL